MLDDLEVCIKDFVDRLSIPIMVKKLTNNAVIPTKAHFDDSGYDLYSSEEVVIDAGTRKLIHTGIVLKIPNGFEGCIRPRSELSLHRGLTVLNSPGTIDSNYRGEIEVIIFNSGNEKFVIKPGYKIARIVFQQLTMVNFIEVDSMNNTDRGYGGFDSTSV